MEPSVLVVLFPVFYVVLAVDLVALCAAIAFLKVDMRAKRERENVWPAIVEEEHRRAA